MCLGALALACAGEDIRGPGNQIPVGPAQPGAGGGGATTSVPIDLDGDGIIDGYDTDGDGIIDVGAVDMDGDGIPDSPAQPIDDNTGTDGGPVVQTCVEGIPATSQVPRLLNAHYNNVLRDLLGVTTLASNNNEPPGTLLNDDFEGAMNAYAWDAYQTAAAAIASEVISGPNRANFMACDGATAGCFEQTIRDFGKKAFRRPLTEEEVQSFMRLTTIEPAGTVDEIAEAILYAFLVSPSFIMTPEVGSTPEGTAIKLTSHEVATRLALTLWGSTPDQALMDAADADQLQTPDQIAQQAQRMLQDREKSGPQIAAAHRAYLQMNMATSHWWKVDHDPAVFPTYSQNAIPAMQDEIDAFFTEVAFSGGTFQDLFLSPVAYVNQDNAPLYGLDPASYGPDLTQVTLDANQRPGFLTRSGFLSSFSNYDATSPILRGAFITVYVLGVNPGAPDPNAILNATLPPGTYYTRREQIEAITAPPACATCHGQYVNPPGFALENFDAIGNWQTVDRLGGNIDSSATVTFSDTTVKTISTPLELMQEIVNQPLAKSIYAQQLVSYAYRRLPNENDACIVNDLNAKLASSDYGILNLFADITQADSFRLRTVGQ